eukprot:Colp12_sorted_trinity150504_noHs@25287
MSTRAAQKLLRKETAQRVSKRVGSVQGSSFHSSSNLTSSNNLLEPTADESAMPIIEPEGSVWKRDLIGIWEMLRDNKLSLLLVFIIFGIVAHAVSWPPTVVFILNFIAIIPLAWLMGQATEELACRTGQTLGGLLNATFGNAVELILSIASLKEGLIEVVQGSLLGSILSNLLLVLGMCFLAGGMKFPSQSFNKQGATTFCSLLLIATIGLTIPTAYYSASGENAKNDEVQLSHIVAILLALVYIFYLTFQLKTHSHLFQEEEEENHPPVLSLYASVGLLAIVTVCVAVCSEFLVQSIDDVRDSWGVSETFIGVILLPIVGNAAEHATAVTVAMKDKMDLAIGVAVGSSIQIALLVVPVTVIIGWCIGNQMDLDFHVFPTVVLFATVLIVNIVISDGESNWLEGALLMVTYVVIAVACWYYEPKPDAP